MVTRVALVSALLWTASACREGEDIRVGSGSDPTGLDGPVMRHLDANSDRGQDAEIAGKIELDRECLYVVLETDQRYPIVWPAGTTWDRGSSLVRLPTGETVEEGDEVVGSGGYRSVEDAAAIAGPSAAELAQECLDDSATEVAVVNNQSDAIARRP